MDHVRSWLRGSPPRREAGEGEVAQNGGVIREPPMEIDGRCLTIEEFREHLQGLTFPEGRPNRVFLHHTWRPTRDTWAGRTSILGMKAYYEQQRWVDEQGRQHEGWTAGPHLFIADDGIWLFSDLNYDGVGVAGHNTGSRHIEMVGNFDVALPDGRTWANTVAATALLLERLGLQPEQLSFHRDYSTKTCPGRMVQKPWVISQVQRWLDEDRAARRARDTALRQRLTDLAGELLFPAANGTALADAARQRGLLGPISNEVPIELGGRAYIVQLYAEALLVPVYRWDEVASLGELEATGALADAASSPAGAKTAPEDQSLPIDDVTTPPYDVIRFDGKLR
ncbi:MAG: peptidoglycan recognition family protein [Anaerolineales bacterium]